MKQAAQKLNLKGHWAGISNDPATHRFIYGPTGTLEIFNISNNFDFGLFYLKKNDIDLFVKILKDIEGKMVVIMF
jgi:hypothetical protein